MENKDLTTAVEPRALSANEIKANVNLIQQVMASVMKVNIHYGKVPGCGDKVVLLKAGAEKILSTFRIAAQPMVEDLSKEDEVRYRVICNGISMANGTFLGAGVGECSSNEDKYKWKKPSCEKEYETTPEDRKRIKYKEFSGKCTELKQIRTSPADVANTVLKMAKKRAQVDMTLTVTAASDCFEQDLEEITDEMDIHDKAPVNREMPKAKETVQTTEQTKSEQGVFTVSEALNHIVHKDEFSVQGKFSIIKITKNSKGEDVFNNYIEDISCPDMVMVVKTKKSTEIQEGAICTFKVQVYNPKGTETAAYYEVSK